MTPSPEITDILIQCKVPENYICRVDRLTSITALDFLVLGIVILLFIGGFFLILKLAFD